MPRYIDADKLNKKKKYLFQTQGMPFPKSEWFIKADDLFSAPTADVVPRAEVAREIFEEIDKIIVSDEIDSDLKYDEYYGACVAIVRVDEKVAELKKKYIGED